VKLVRSSSFIISRMLMSLSVRFKSEVSLMSLSIMRCLSLFLQDRFLLKVTLL